MFPNNSRGLTCSLGRTATWSGVIVEKPFVNVTQRLFWIARISWFSVPQNTFVFVVYPCDINSASRIPRLFPNTVAMILRRDSVCFALIFAVHEM